MNKKSIRKMMDSVDDRFVEEAKDFKAVKHWKKYVSMAACLCLLVIGVAAVGQRGLFVDSDIEAPDKNPSYAATGVFIPAVELPENVEPGVSYDMIGLIVYKGNIYTQAQSYGWLSRADASDVEDLIGEYIGDCKGTIDEWSSQEDYATELASTAQGPVHKVNGYSDDFRICTVNNWDGQTYIEFFDRVNGITLNKGSDLFIDRLRIDQGYTAVEYLDDYSWNNVQPNEQICEEVKVSEETMTEFFQGLYSGKFVDLGNSDIYDKAKGHVFITMKDGTQVELRLAEGGYVGYQGLGWIFVKMDGEVFDQVYEEIK